MNTAYIATAAVILEGITARNGQPPQHSAHIREFRADRWDRIVTEQQDRVRRAIIERRAREDAGIWS